MHLRICEFCDCCVQASGQWPAPIFGHCSGGWGVRACPNPSVMVLCEMHACCVTLFVSLSLCVVLSVDSCLSVTETSWLLRPSGVEKNKQSCRWI